MITIEELKKDVENSLSDFRYQHSLGVLARMQELIQVYKVDQVKAELVAIAHDIGKEMTNNESILYAKENQIAIDDVEQLNPFLLHAKIGADIVKRRYGFTKDMQKAIEYHTVGDPEMDLLAKVLYVADKTEESRKHQGFDIDYEAELAKKDIEEAIIYLIGEEMKELIEKKKMIHPKSIETRNTFLMKMKK